MTPDILRILNDAEALDRKFDDITAIPSGFAEIYRPSPLDALFPEQDHQRASFEKTGMEALKKEIDRKRNYENAVIQLERRLAPPDPPPQAQLAQDEPATVAQGEPDKPKEGTAERECQMHKRECQEIARRLWGETPTLKQADLKEHPEMEFYVKSYPGKNTIPGWLSEVDPRPKESRRGRPKKIPV